MDRAEKQGIGIAAAAHALLFAGLSLSLFSARIPKPPVADTMDVQFVKDVGLTSAAPKVSQEAPAPSQAPEQGPPEESAPPPPTPEPTPRPEPKPAPAKPAPPKPAPPKPAPQPKPEPKPQPKPEKPEPKAKPAPQKPTPKPAPEKKKAGLPSDFLKDLPKDQAGKGHAKPKGSLLGKDFLKGIAADKSPGKADAPHASQISARSLAGLAALIAQQVKPCYNPPAGGADAGQIVTSLDIRMRKDGSVASVAIAGQSGVNGQNGAYARQMGDAAKRAVLRCAPLKLPPELYEGGWDELTFRFRPDQMQ